MGASAATLRSNRFVGSITNIGTDRQKSTNGGMEVTWAARTTVMVQEQMGGCFEI